MRRGTGIARLQQQKEDRAKYKEAGEELENERRKEVELQMTLFKTHLQRFAQSHGKEIAQNGVLRAKFQKMCAALQVDPLMSSKGFWADILGAASSDYFYELAVQIVHGCLVLGQHTDGLIPLALLLGRIQGQMERSTVSEDDIVRAVKLLKPLGSGFCILEGAAGVKYVRSRPMELDMDGTAILVLASGNGGVVDAKMLATLNWASERVHSVIGGLLSDGLLWVDDFEGVRAFFCPAMHPLFSS